MSTNALQRLNSFHPICPWLRPIHRTSILPSSLHGKERTALYDPDDLKLRLSFSGNRPSNWASYERTITWHWPPSWRFGTVLPSQPPHQPPFPCSLSGISPDDLNNHYARISNDLNYSPPALMSSALNSSEIVSPPPHHNWFWRGLCLPVPGLTPQCFFLLLCPLSCHQSLSPKHSHNYRGLPLYFQYIISLSRSPQLATDPFLLHLFYLDFLNSALSILTFVSRSAFPLLTSVSLTNKSMPSGRPSPPLLL